jgi:hypothetical protein
MSLMPDRKFSTQRSIIDDLQIRRLWRDIGAA